MAKLTNNETGHGLTDVVVLDWEDLENIVNGTNPFTGDSLATAGQLPIATLPAGGGVELCGVIETVAVAGTTTLVFDIGVTGADPDEFIDNLDVDGMTTGAAVWNTGDSFTQGAGTTTNIAGSLPVDGTAAAQDIILEVTDANIANITAGEVVIGLRIIDLGKFSTGNN